MTSQNTFSLGEYGFIALCDLLKLTGLVNSGGHAKQVIAEGCVLRNGIIETRKTAKIKAGETIAFGNTQIYIKQ